MMYRLSWIVCMFTLVSSFDLSTRQTICTRTISTVTPPRIGHVYYNLHRNAKKQSLFILSQSSASGGDTIDAIPGTTATVAAAIDIKKEAVKIFGRLAEKYIALDSSGGNCCYSGCTGCEYRLPDGGYKMADQTAARPKWIPHYDVRVMNTKQHTTKWSSNLFLHPNVTAITKDEFVNAIVNLEYVPPLGGPYISASAAHITDTTVLQKVFDVIAEEKTKLTKFKMSIRIKQLSNGEEGMTWQSFERMIENMDV